MLFEPLLIEIAFPPVIPTVRGACSYRTCQTCQVAISNFCYLWGKALGNNMGFDDSKSNK